jgi:hypothetical protein
MVMISLTTALPLCKCQGPYLNLLLLLNPSQAHNHVHNHVHNLQHLRQAEEQQLHLQQAEEQQQHLQQAEELQ